MGDNIVQTAHLTQANLNGGLHLVHAWARLQFFKLSLNDLQMNGKGIQRVPQFMCHTRGQHEDGIHLFILNQLLSGKTLLRDVSKDYGQVAKPGNPSTFRQGHHIEAHKTLLGIGQLDFPGNKGSLVLRLEYGTFQAPV